MFLWIFLGVAMAGRYPSGPSADKDPALQEYSDPIFVGFVTTFSITLGSVLFYSLIRHLMTADFGGKDKYEISDNEDIELVEKSPKKRRESDKLGSDSDRTSFVGSLPALRRRASTQRVFGDTDIALLEDIRLEPQGYAGWLFGYYGLFMLVCLVLYMVALFITIIAEYYWGCQSSFAEGVDNQCYYGNYPITGWNNNNLGEYFLHQLMFWFWWVWLVIFGTLFSFKYSVRNWFRFPCSLSQADHVYIWVKDGEGEILCVDPTYFVQLSRTIRNWFRETFDLSEAGHYQTMPVQTMWLAGEEIKFIEFEFARYIIESDKLFKVQVTTLSEEIKCIADDTVKEGLDEQNAGQRLQMVGQNSIPYHVDSILELILSEFLTPFYLYQWQIYMVWFYWSYLYTAAIEFAIVIFSASMSMYLKRKAQRTIKQLTDFNSTETVKRRNKSGELEWKEIDGKYIVPGDIIRVRSGWVVPCDIVLLDGVAVCDEAGLTGESMPIAKSAAREDSDKSFGEHGASIFTLFAGTTVLQAGSQEEDLVYGVVMRTGISTTKGDLVSHILRPGHMVFKYDEEYTVAFAMLLTYGFILFWLNVILMDANETNAHWVIKFLKGIFTVSQMLSPLLPLSLVVGQAASSKRLIEEMEIFCVDPKRISICGKIRVTCFDKTGTLTREGLDFMGAACITEGVLGERQDAKNCSDLVVAGLATAHAVTKFKDTLVGNQVEVKMFDSTGWELIERQGEVSLVRGQNKEYGIPKRFEFDHALMSMSVITTSGKFHEQARVFSKGAAERIVSLCRPETVPKDFLEVSKGYAKEGFYVLALATRELYEEDWQNLTRPEVEKEQSMDMLGLILFRNELKDDTTEAIALLREGNTRSVMITGDNAQCGFFIAKESGMIMETAQVYLAEPDGDGVVWIRQNEGFSQGYEEEYVSVIPDNLLNDVNVELAVTGSSYEILKECGELERVLLKLRICARFLPNQKTEMVKLLIKRGLVVGYCGDGGNDCGALRAAHAGLALSEAEASVVSPFTGKSKSVMAMVDLLREGRCALATSFSTWKFIITFGQAYAICKVSCTFFDVIMPSLDYLMIDVVVLIAISFALTLSRPLDVLGKHRPTASLLGPHTVGSIGGITLINFLFVIIAWAVATGDSKYITWPVKCEDGASWWLLGDNWEAFIAFSMFIFQMFHCGFLYGFGTRYRKPVWRNWGLCLMTVFYWIFFACVLLTDANDFNNLFHSPAHNFNRHKSDSTTWGFYQNVNEYGLPMQSNDECASIAQANGVWSDLYASFDGVNATGQTNFDPQFVTSGNYIPGSRAGGEAYDACVFAACDKKKPECDCGKKDGVLQDLSTDYSMPGGVRGSLFAISICNQIATFLYMTVVMDGPVGEMLRQPKENYIELNL